MPYFVPAWAFRIIGSSAITFPAKIVNTACHQFIPSPISPDASRYVGMHAAIDTHRAAMSRAVQVRWSGGTGAMSTLP